MLRTLVMTAVAVTIGSHLSWWPSAASAAERPNVLLIISDDVGTDVTSSMYPSLIESLVEQYGPEGHDHPQYRRIDGRPASTPTLAALARDGLAFSNAWVHAFCSPTRASLLTGLFGAKTRVLTYADALSPSHTSFVQVLRDDGGYATAVFGKWHMAGLPGEPEDYPGMKPKQAGFDLFRGNLHAALPTFWQYPYQVQDAETSAGEWREGTPPERSLPGIAPTTYAPVVKAADTIAWIREQEAADTERPWFVWLAFNLSHATSIQRPSAMAVPNADTLDEPSRAEMEACGGEFGTNNVGECSGESLMRAMTNSMDTIIGKVIEAVDELDPNTYIIYVGDNGTPMYGRPNLDFIDNLYITRTGRGKGTAYNSGSEVPLVVRGPGVAPGVSDEFVHAADLFPTILELAGLAAPKTVAGENGEGGVALDAVSLAPIVRGEAAAVRDPDTGFVLSESINLLTEGTPHIGVRNARYKLVCVGGASREHCEFHDLIDDPLEEYALAAPASCDGHARGVWAQHEARWHFCQLLDVIHTRSFM